MRSRRELFGKHLGEAIHVCTVFSIIDRIAGALAFQVPSPEESARVGFILKNFGYSTSSLPG